MKKDIMREYVPRGPEAPTNKELREGRPQSPEVRAAIVEKQAHVSSIIGGSCIELLLTAGGCAMTEDEAIIMSQARRLAQLDGIVGLEREPTFKPRTDPTKWHGLITTEPEAAYRIANNISSKYANWAAEIGTDPLQLERESDLLTLAWKGGRNDEEAELTERLALHDPMLPVAVKNNLDGDLEKALADVEKIEKLRGPMGARAILLFRGGDNAKTPETWEAEYLRAHDLTDGRFLVDWAHGGEQAHDPNGGFDKSIKGQIACMEHTIDIAQRTGKTPVGIFTEASSAVSPTDPVMPFEDAINGAQRLAKLKRSLLV